jgi:hypothetical protein
LILMPQIIVVCCQDGLVKPLVSLWSIIMLFVCWFSRSALLSALSDTNTHLFTIVI